LAAGRDINLALLFVDEGVCEAQKLPVCFASVMSVKMTIADPSQIISELRKMTVEFEFPARAAKSISVRDALVRYGIGRTKLYELLGNGSIEARKLGAKTLVDVHSADTFFQSLPGFRQSQT